jgi:hypothetical protein
MIHAEKLADWKVRHPAKAQALEKAVCYRLGMRFGIKSELAREAVEQWMAAVLAALLGWGEEPAPDRELSGPKAEAIKVLDLEVPPMTGRDRAAGVEHDD